MNIHRFVLAWVAVVLMIAADVAGAEDGGTHPCAIPLPPCVADIAPPGGDGAANVQDLLAVINTFGQNGVPTSERPQGDCAPLPNGDCIVNVLDLLAVINSWGACTGGCPQNCPPDAVFENEPCLVDGDLDTTNGGCNSTPNVFGTMLTINGPTVCGMSSTRLNGSSQVRDTDWYYIIIPATADYRIQLSAEFAAQGAIVTGLGGVGGPCNNPIFAPPSITFVNGNCETVTSQEVLLPAGIVCAVFVSPQFFSGYPCSGGSNKYWIRIFSQ